MDEIYIKGLKIFAYHGVNPEETENGQEFELDITMFADLSKARESDNLEDTINYAAARKIINAAMTERPYKLIERAAEVVATALLDSIDKLLKVEVILKKPNAPMSAVFDYVAVKITKKR
ncbi:MAG: dihydroneopterin aldolase [Ruminococcaceae bacterium]|nr:dihydroneopterin aldolase [Oscillospiraceae bacterium]